MILSFIGTVGSGKTLSMTYEAWKYYKLGYRIFSNYHLEFPHTKLNWKILETMIAERTQLENAVIAIDEMHIWIDSRSSMEKKRKGITYFILQTRKANIRLLYTTQHLGQVDKRLRDTTDILVFCRNMTNKTSLVADDSVDVYIQQEFVYQWRENMKPAVKVIYANPVFKLFNTKEIVSFE